jgi:hypothetical protein
MDILDEIIKVYDEEIIKLKASLGNGSAEDYAHYRQMVGSISSIEWAIQTVKQTIKKRTYADEEE